MINSGFTHYNKKPITVTSTTADAVASLSAEQKVAVLNGFIRKVNPNTISFNECIPKNVVTQLYRSIDAIEELSRSLMRGEIVITPAVIDEAGEITKPAVYNKQPETSTALKNAVASDFANDFTGTQVTAILAKMVKHSKYSGDGTWDYYKAEVKK